jgi:hypothetical protein
MSEMEKMNSEIHQKLRMQAQDMGIEWKDAAGKINWTEDKGYHLSGYDEYRAVEKGIKEGTLADRVESRNNRMKKAMGDEKL